MENENTHELSRDLGSREKYIPLQCADLVDYLCYTNHIGDTQRGRFRQFAGLILSLLHHLYRQRHEQLSTVYSPLDPDCDKLLRAVPVPNSRNQCCHELLGLVEGSLARANYHRLNDDAIRQAILAASRWGVRMQINFEKLRFLQVYGRGNLIGQRGIRNWRTWFRLQQVDVELFQRIVVVFRTSENFAPDQFDPNCVYLRMFKNVPKQDVDMMLPATGIQMTWLDHSKIVVPSIYAAGMTLWRFLRNVMLLTFLGIFKTAGFVLLVLFAIGFGVKSMFSYRANTKRRYMLSMAQSLYYQNLDNNAGVILRLLEEGEQQHACEAILAYFVGAIMNGGRPISLAEMDRQCEALLHEATGGDIDFDVEDTARTLVHLGVMKFSPAGWTSLSLNEALDQLDRTWDNWFELMPTVDTEKKSDCE
ncbi:MAG: DUF3754 domain-containing protein [Planctomycetales bacterium]|nr:DUF3754 domain-containing protein [Planctomycetales bacterium]